MGDTHQIVLQMRHAEERGDRRAARALAQEVLASPQDGDMTAAAAQVEARASVREENLEEGERPSVVDRAADRLSASNLLARTQPDAFLLVVGLLGLGLTVWLVYNYVL